MARLTILLSTLAMLLAGSIAHQASAQAPVYRWVDAQGSVHYGDKASAPRGANPFLVQAPAPASDRQYLSRDVESNISTGAPGDDGPALDAASSAAQADEDESVRQACQVAQRNQTLLADESQNVLNDAGTEVLSDAARAQRLARVELEIQAYCNVLASDGEGS